MKNRLAVIAAPYILAVLASPSLARAQSPAQPQPGQQPASTDTRALAETLFFTARGLMEAGRYTEACAKLNESYRLDAAAGTLLNLAVCNEKIGKIASAWGEFRDALSEAKRMNRADREQLATDRIKVLQPELPYLTITVPPQVRAIKGVEILRNGIPLQAAAWDTDLPVDPGDVEVIERAPDYKPKTLHVSVKNKEHASLTAEPLELAPIERPPPPFWTSQRTLGVILIGAGVVAAGVGTYFGIQAINEKKDSDNTCSSLDGELRCGQPGVDAMNKAQTDAWISDIAIGAGIVSAGVGAYFMLTGGQKEEGPPQPTIGSTGWTWAVNPGPRGAMGFLSRTF